MRVYLLMSLKRTNAILGVGHGLFWSRTLERDWWRWCLARALIGGEDWKPRARVHFGMANVFILLASLTESHLYGFEKVQL